MPSPPPKVSVVVPVYNPGEHIDACLDSLLGQTMPAGELELIFVDDGSTDGTAARLAALAEAHAHVRVERIPNSGWPGRPRNIGVDMARGEFVYFVDNDDWLETDALERMYARALADGADVVIGKVVARGKTVPRELFRHELRAVPFDDVKLLGLLTPHKLFRRSMLVEHGIRFPEGRRRLEDHLFVVHAYFHAANGISVLAGRPCYHWALRDLEGHASYQRFEPEDYYGDLREVLDLVRGHTEPGPLRDRLLSHWYRGKMLGRVGGRAFTRRAEAYNRRLVDTVRELALDGYDDRVHEHLAFNLRVRSQLLRAGDYDGLLRLAEFERGLGSRVKARVGREGAGVAVRLRASLPGLEFERWGDRIRWVRPEPLHGHLAGADVDATEALAAARAQVYLHSPEHAAEYLLPAHARSALDESGRLTLAVRATVDGATAAAGSVLPAGEWELRAVILVAGFSHARSLRRNGTPLVLVSDGRGGVSARRDVLPRTLLARRVAARLAA